jgi:N-acetylmuramic acid 6-phosphate (MurNAc-6-P) etherase
VSHRIDALSPLEIVRLINAEDRAPAAVARAANIARAVGDRRSAAMAAG